MLEIEGTNRDSRNTTSLTLRELAAIFFRQSRPVAATFFIVVTATLVYTWLSPRYEAHFRVLLRHGRSDPVISAQASSLADFNRSEITEEELNSEAELLRDENLLRRLVPSAGLVPDDPAEKNREAEIEHAARKLARSLEVEPLRRSNLIEVRYRSADPQKSARVLTALSRAYIEKRLELQRPRGETSFFDEEAEAYGRKLEQSEAQLVQYTQSRGVSLAAVERDIALQKLGDAEAGYRQITLDSAQTEQRIAALHHQLASFPPRSVTQKRWSDNPQLLQQLKGRLLELQLRRTELTTRFEPSYPLVREVDRQIEETRQSIASEALTPVRDETSDKDPNYEWARIELERAEVERESLRAGEAAARTQIASLRVTAREMQSASVAQQGLVRNAKAAEEDYLLYRRKREEARIGDALDERRILNVALVELPVVPALPVHSTFFYLLIALGLGVAMSTGAAFVAEYFDPTIRTPEEAQTVLAVPVLAWLPAAQTPEGVFEVVQGRRRKAARE
jgi:polysaccharide biosynthesis transport protein